MTPAPAPAAVAAARLPWPRALGALWALTAVAALLAAVVPGAAAALRDAFAFAFTPAAPSLHEAAQIALTNLRVAALPALAAVAVSRLRAARRVCDPLLTAVIAGNVGIVGAAVGAYGPARLAPWLVHLPLEWAGLAVPLGGYLAVRRGRPLTARAALVGALATVGLLAAGALTETYLTPRP